MTKDTGGAAFPRPAWTDSIYNARIHAQDDMTLRDYFAAKAMQGLCVNSATFSNSELNIKSISEWSYQFADAMLKAREL